MADNREQIRQLLYTIAFSQDTLDWKLFCTSWVQSESIDFDLSGHLEAYQHQQLPVDELAQMSHAALSGFDGSQHVITNIVIDFSEDAAEDSHGASEISSEGFPTHSNARTANARAIVTAYHYLDISRLKDLNPDVVSGTDCECYVTMRGVWNLTVVDTGLSNWVVKGISVKRLVPLAGNQDLYNIAKKRFESGHDRNALSW